MPLARIFTRNPERTGDLAAQLRQQGYKVEVTSPEQKHLAPADLEIEFELCERADVLERAAGLADELEADIAVAPGILQSAPEPKVEPKSEQILQSAAQPVAEKPAREAESRSEREREFEAAFISTVEAPAAMGEEPAVIDIPVMEQAPLPPVAIAQEPVRMAENPVAAEKSIVDIPVNVSEPARSGDPEPYLAQLTPFGKPSSADIETPQVNQAARRLEKPALPAATKVDYSKAAERGKHVLQDGAKIAAQSWTSAQSLASSTADSVRGYFHEYKKKAQVKSAEARAAQAARLLDLEQRRAEAQQRALELEAARAEAAARLAALVRQREPGLPKPTEQTQTEQSYYWRPTENVRESQQPERIYTQGQTKLEQPRLDQPRTDQPKKPEESKRPDPSATAFAKPPSSASIPKPPKTKRNFAGVTGTPLELWRTVNPPLRAVLTGAAAVSALFIMGIALGLFHSRAPLANTADNHGGGVTLQQGGGATVQTSGPGQTAAAKPQPATTAQPQSGTVQAQVAKPSPRISHAQQMVAQQTETRFGDDVVIRHFSRPAPTQKPKQSGQQAGLKHFSDMEN